MYLKLFWEFLKIGAFTFGGGYAMIPLIQDAVLSNEWMSLNEMLDFIAVSESTPGPVAVNMATYVGMKTCGILGAACATLGVVLPSFVIILIIAKFFKHFSEATSIKAVMRGIQPAAIGLIAAAIYSIAGNTMLTDATLAKSMANPEFWASVIIFIVIMILGIKKVHPIIMILVSAALGVAANLLIRIL